MFAGYSLAVVTYLLARFIFALFYRPFRDLGHRPSVSVIIPAFNEEDGIEATIAAALAGDYPADKVEVIAVNDGSSDDTWARMRAAQRRFPQITIVDLGRNYGKRASMAEGYRRSSGEILLFVDSDSYLARDGIHISSSRSRMPASAPSSVTPTWPTRCATGSRRCGATPPSG